MINLFLKFGVVGIANTLITIVSFMVLIHFGMNYLFANILSYSLGVANSYYWNRTWVFKTDNSTRQLYKFIIVNLLTLGITTFILFIFVQFAQLHPIIGQALATGVGMVFNFLLNKSWTFRIS